MSRSRLLLGLLAALLLAAGIYALAGRTEWVEQEVNLPLRGEAATDDWYAAQALLRGLKVQVVRQSHLDTLPPPPATLWLESTTWDLFPERSERLRQWVQQGGHLVVRSHQLAPDQPLAAWAPIAVRNPPAPVPDPQPSTPTGAPSRRTPAPPIDPCQDLHEEPEGAAFYAGAPPLRVCSFFGGRQWLDGKTPPDWSLQTRQGATYFMRVPVGAGHLTAMGPLPVRNRDLPNRDHALALMATLNLRPGQTLWLVTDETRPPLLATLWQRGAPALLLGALALALALWRAGTRFGPKAAEPPAARRSVAEQVRGTARFIWNGDPAALLAAQQRATEEAAQARIPRYLLMSTQQRAAALARLTGLAADALGRALTPGRMPDGASPSQTLALLESARRRLSPPSQSPPQGPPWP
ncbi:MAG TPA: DUF4350 domain-containing protein [Burkholderiaceae bacterium]|nr:DUF4350 domain-containing protein [Burkholderiaceae bacterium]